MIERTAAVPEARRVRDGAADVLLRALRGGRKVVAEGEAGRDGRCKSAPGAVRVGAVDSRGTEFVERVSVEQQVHDLRAVGLRGVPAVLQPYVGDALSRSVAQRPASAARVQELLALVHLYEQHQQQRSL